MELLKPKKRSIKTVSPVWIIPIVTILVGLWLGLDSWQKRGTEIEIVFESASDIEVGKTEVRLKDVPVGKVKEMRLSPDLSSVRVTLAIDRQVKDHLSENSRFWLVSPRVSASGISNLGTLISGIYIVMDPGERGKSRRNFKGLSEPPAIKSDDIGTQFILLADQLGSLDIGSPIYHRNVRVGEVTGYKLDAAGTHVEIRIFVQAPYDKLVYTRTHFLNVSGFGLTVGADGIKAQMSSLASLIGGGVAFENTAGFEVATRAPDSHTFNLYSDKESIVEGRYTLRYFYRLKFSHSVRGLSVGAPVEFRGVKVGEVLEVSLGSVEKGPGSLHVFIGVEPQRFQSDAMPTRDEFDQQMAELVKQGLRGQMRSGSLVTGSRYVALTFPKSTESAALIVNEQFSDLPTQDSAFDQLDQQLASITSKFESVPFDAMGRDLAESLSSLQSMLKTLKDNKTAVKLDQTLGNVSSASGQLEAGIQQVGRAFDQLEVTLRSVDAVVAPESELQFDLNDTMKSVSGAAEALESLLMQLHQKPDSLIFGGEKLEN